MAWLLTIAPILVLLAGLATCVIASWAGRSPAFSLRVGVGLCIALGLWVGFGDGFSVPLQTGFLVSDGLSRFALVVMLLSTSCLLFIAERDMRRLGLLKSSFPALILLALIGALITVMARDLLALFIGVEIQSLALIALVAFRRGSRSATASGMEQALLSLISSAVMLAGIVLTVAYDGMDYDDLAWGMSQSEGPVSAIGPLLLLLGLLAKMQLAPFHLLVPDFLRHAPRPVAAYGLVVMRVSLLVALWRFVHLGVPTLAPLWGPVLLVAAALNMGTGVLKALTQDDFKTMIGWMGLAHMGLALAAIAEGIDAAFLTSLAFFALAMIGIAGFWSGMERDGRPVSSLLALEGLGQTSPGRAAALSILLFTLAALPPCAGFLVSFGMLDALIRVGAWEVMALCVLTYLGLAIAALRIVGKLFFMDPIDPIDPEPGAQAQIITICAAFAALMGTITLLGVPGWALRTMFVP